jgi:hypothetical protein
MNYQAVPGFRGTRFIKKTEITAIALFFPLAVTLNQSENSRLRVNL